MNVKVNGSPMAIPEEVNILGLLGILDIAPARSVVEVNGVIIDRASFGACLAREGDRIEIVRFVGGG